MNVTGKAIYVDYAGRKVRLCNQRSEEWTALYAEQGGKDDLHSAGCGLFSTANAVSFMSGLNIDVEELAKFAMASGARDNTGTDRPTLLRAMQESGLAAQFGFSYLIEGLRNDLDILPEHLKKGNAALCNLRVGHIVALVGMRERNGETEVLAADPYSESNDERIRDNVREVVEGSEIISVSTNKSGMKTGMSIQYALFYVPLKLAKDFNLLFKT